MRARTPSPRDVSGYFTPAPPRVLAHRGLALDAPENTLLAFLHAVNAGATHIETDVHGSADGVAMISHDPDLRRVAGRDVRVAQLTASELRRVPLGEAQGFCSLAEALDAFPETRFNIDVKSADAIPGTVQVIRDLRATERVLIGSFSTSRRRAVVRQLPGVATSLSASGVLPAVHAARSGAVGALTRMLRGIDAVQLPAVVVGVASMTPRSVRSFHEAGVEAHVWTVNDPEMMVCLLDMGVDGIVTDRADLALAILEERRRAR